MGLFIIAISFFMAPGVSYSPQAGPLPIFALLLSVVPSVGIFLLLFFLNFIKGEFIKFVFFSLSGAYILNFIAIMYIVLQAVYSPDKGTTYTLLSFISFPIFAIPLGLVLGALVYFLGWIKNRFTK